VDSRKAHHENKNSRGEGRLAREKGKFKDPFWREGLSADGLHSLKKKPPPVLLMERET